jgi:hypothetical protein
MQTFFECFSIILTGDKDASRQAARQVRKLLYSSKSDNQFGAIASTIENAPKEYEKISEDWRQENFIMAVSVLYFLHNKESQPDFLFPWLYHLIQHPSGNIRHAAVRMYEIELGPLTVHLRFPNKKSSYLHKLTPEQADMILFELFANLTDLIKDLWQPAYKKYKYLSSLPSGAYKSVQMVLASLQEDCGKEYMARLEDSYRKVQIIEDRKQIMRRVDEGNVLDKTVLTLAQSRLKQMRQELETGMLQAMLVFYPKFDFKSVVAKVYEGKLTLTELVKLISESINLENQTIGQRQAFLEFVSTIWNLYPHKELEGRSPYEIAAMYEIAENHKNLK